jgi:hypothetical protein
MPPCRATSGRRARAVLLSAAFVILASAPPAARAQGAGGEADLSVEVVAPQGPWVANRELTYEIKLTNRGPHDATGVRVQGSGFSSDEFVSAAPPAGGRCEQDGSNFNCQLGRLPKNATAVFRLTLRPYESPSHRPTEPRPLPVLVYAFGRERDSNPADNEGRADVEVHPDPNQGPEVKLVSPKPGELFDAPAVVKLEAEARDPDGTLSKVEFYDGPTLLGEGSPAGRDRYVLEWSGVKAGRHLPTVLVTDSGGRSDYDVTQVFVNGPLSVRLDGPPPDAVFKTKINLRSEGTLNRLEYERVSFKASARVKADGRKVKEVTFFLNALPLEPGGSRGVARPAGVDGATGELLYEFDFGGLSPGTYELTATAVDEEGVESHSHPVRVRASAAPPVKLSLGRGPRARGETFEVLILADLVIPPHLQDSSRKGTRVAFYADGKLIGSAPAEDYIQTAVSFRWSDVPPGTHTVTALVTNGDGAVSPPSNPLRITVGGKQ